MKRCNVDEICYIHVFEFKIDLCYLMVFVWYSYNSRPEGLPEGVGSGKHLMGNSKIV